MSHSKDYLIKLLDSVHPFELTSDEQQVIFRKIRNRLHDGSDIHIDLQTLYKVNEFYNFALVLMYIVEQSEKNPSKTMFSSDEKMLVVWNFIRAMGGVPTSDIKVVEVIEEEDEETIDVGHQIDETPSFELSVNETISIEAFGFRLDQLIEAMQQGDDSRQSLLSEIISMAQRYGSEKEEILKDFNNLAIHIVEFLTYVHEEDLYEDVRVMNLLSNLSSTAGAFQHDSDEEKISAIQESITTLSDFRSLFE